MGRMRIVTCLAGICCVFAGTGAFAAATNDAISEARAKLRQAVEKARGGNLGELSSLAESLQRKDNVYSKSELQPDYISLLKDKSGNVHLYAVQFLVQFKNAATRDALCDYLKTRDFAKLKAYAHDGRDTTPEALQSALEPMAVSYAILALAEIGDRSVIPLLSDLRDDVTWEAEWVGRPVEHALGKLGAVRVLASTPANAEQRQIAEASGAISGVKDPNCVPELMAVVRDDKVQECFRLSALSALGQFNLPETSRLLVGVMNDSNAPMDFRKAAANSAGKIGDRTTEASVLAHANDPKSPLRIYAFMGLVQGTPDKYLSKWFNAMLDPNEDLAFRMSLISWDERIARDELRARKQDLYRCLQAAEQNGRPIDEIRVKMWCKICDFFGEEPALVLTSKAPSTIGSMRGILERRAIQRNRGQFSSEQRALVDEKIDTLVTLYGRDAGTRSR